MDDAAGQTLTPEQKATGIRPLKPRIAKLVAAVEADLIGRALALTCWNRKRAAELLGISYRSLLYKIKDYRLDERKKT